MIFFLIFQPSPYDLLLPLFIVFERSSTNLWFSCVSRFHFIVGVIELHEKHTAPYPKEKVEELLNKFEIKRSQIYLETVDSVRNVVKAVDLLGEIEFQQPDVNECSPRRLED